MASKMLRNMVGFFRRAFARYPTDPRVLEVRNAVVAGLSPRKEGPQQLLAIQCVEDPVYFALFASIISGLRERCACRCELVFVPSINGAIGVGFKAGIKRSVFVRWLASRKWRRAFGPLADGIAYRSASMCHPVADLTDLLRSFLIWRRLGFRKESFSLQIDKVQVEDLIIDSYLRFKPAPKFDKFDPFVIRLIWQCHRDVRRARRYFQMKKPRLYVTSYATYIEHGVAVRVALQEGVPVRSFGSLIEFGKELTLEDWFHTPNTENYRRDFAALDDPEVRIAEAERGLVSRLAGEIDGAMAYMRASAYADSSERPPDGLNGAAVIFLHDFYDSPHVYHDMLFPDFWVWVCTTVEQLSEAGISFFIKPHPNQIDLSDTALMDLKSHYPSVRFLSSRITNTQLVKAGIICGITVYGSVAHELAYFGVPTICCARHPHHAFDFCRTAGTYEQYSEYLRSPWLMPIGVDEMKKQALIFYYMHNLHGGTSRLELRAKFTALWKAYAGNEASDADVLGAVDDLRKASAFGGFVSGLVSRIQA